MKRMTALTLAALLMLSQTGCGESLLIEDATEASTDSSVSVPDTPGQESTPDPAQSSSAVASIMGQLHPQNAENNPGAENGSEDTYTANFVFSTSNDVIDLIPYEITDISLKRSEESDTIQLRVNEDSRDHTISGLRFMINGTLNDFPCDVEEYDTFRGAYACDLNFTDSLSNIITVFTSSRTGRHLTTFYSYVGDKANRIGSYEGFVDFLSIDGAGEFTITEATDIQSSTYGAMYVKKKYRTGEEYSYDVKATIQKLILDSNSVGYYPEENHFAVGYPFSLKEELTLYVNGEESYMTGKLPVNFRGVLKEILIEEKEKNMEDEDYDGDNESDDGTEEKETVLNTKVFLVEPEEGWTDRETNINSPIYAPSTAGSDSFDPDDYKGWVSFTELSEVSNEGFYIESQES